MSSQAPLQAQPFRTRLPGPCWQCSEMGLLKAICPKLQRPYPLNIECVYEGKSIKGEVGSSGIDKHANELCPPVEVGKGVKEIEPSQRSKEITINNEELSGLQLMGSC